MLISFPYRGTHLGEKRNRGRERNSPFPFPYRGGKGELGDLRLFWVVRGLNVSADGGIDRGIRDGRGG